MASHAQLSMALIVVGDLNASVSFYTEVIGLEVADRNPTAALLAGADRTPLILRSMGASAARAPGSAGVEFVYWAVNSEEALDLAERALKRRSAYVETRHEDRYSVVEGRDPDGTPVLLAYPAPDQLPLRELPVRIYAW